LSFSSRAARIPDTSSGGVAKIVGGENPQRHSRNLKLTAPVEDIIEFVSAQPVDFLGIRKPVLLSIAAVSIKDDADVRGQRPFPNMMQKATLVEGVEKAEHRSGHVLMIREFARRDIHPF
jgi:hypothetical protein